MLLVTGITGRTGKYFLERLVQEKYTKPIRCILRYTSQTETLDNSGLNIEKNIGDIHDPIFLRNAMEGVSTVLHIASIFLTPFVVQASLDAGVKWLILVHTTGIYSKYKMAAQTYLKIEQDMKAQAKDQIAITILRPTMIYGNLGDQNMEHFIRYTDRFPIFPLIGGGHSLLQPIHVKDLGRSYFDVLENKAITQGKEYILSGERPIAFSSMIKEIGKNLNRRNLLVPVPLWVAHGIALLVKQATSGKIDYVERTLRLCENRSFPHDQAAQDFLFSPIPFEEGIREEVAQYLAAKNPIVLDS